MSLGISPQGEARRLTKARETVDGRAFSLASRFSQQRYVANTPIGIGGNARQHRLQVIEHSLD